MRRKRGQTQVELASSLGAGESYFRGIEGGSKGVSLRGYVEITDRLGVSFSDLVQNMFANDENPS